MDLKMNIENLSVTELKQLAKNLDLQLSTLEQQEALTLIESNLCTWLSYTDTAKSTSFIYPIEHNKKAFTYYQVGFSTLETSLSLGGYSCIIRSVPITNFGEIKRLFSIYKDCIDLSLKLNNVLSAFLELQQIPQSK